MRTGVNRFTDTVRAGAKWHKIELNGKKRGFCIAVSSLVSKKELRYKSQKRVERDRLFTQPVPRMLAGLYRQRFRQR